MTERSISGRMGYTSGSIVASFVALFLTYWAMKGLDRDPMWPMIWLMVVSDAVTSWRISRYKDDTDRGNNT